MLKFVHFAGKLLNDPCKYHIRAAQIYPTWYPFFNGPTRKIGRAHKFAIAEFILNNVHFQLVYWTAYTNVKAM